MKPIDQAAITEIQGGMYIPTRLFKLELTDEIGIIQKYQYFFNDTSTIVGFNDSSVDIYYDDIHYFPRGMSFDDVKMSNNTAIAEMSFKIDDIDHFFLEVLGERGNTQPKCEISLGLIDKVTWQLISLSSLFAGYLNVWSVESNSASITIASDKAAWNLEPTAKYSPSCRWRTYGGTECGYDAVPGTLCGRTYQDCLSRNNQANFGGFRWLPSLQNKKIWWGTVPTNIDE